MSTLRRLWRGGAGRFGILVVSIIVVTALVSLIWTPFDGMTNFWLTLIGRGISKAAARWAPN